MTVTAEARPHAPEQVQPRSLRLPAVAVTLLVLVAVLAVVDLTQGTATISPGQLIHILTGTGDGSGSEVVLASRIPRMAAGLLVGLALGAAGAALQALSRNPLASPDTLAVNAGAYCALTVVAVVGMPIPLVLSAGVAFAGGLLAAVVVLALSGLGSGTVRLVLAGSALGLGLSSVTSGLILLFPQQTTGLYQWGEGSISQNGASGVWQMIPPIVVGMIGLVLLARRVDTFALGDDGARSLGVNVRRTRITAVVMAVLLSAAAVTLAGPIGFVGLCAPALLRPAVRHVPGLVRARAFLPLAGLVGAAVVLISDVLLRAAVGADASVQVPTGVITSLVGAVFLVVLAFRARDGAVTPPTDRHPVVTGTRFAVTLALLVLVAAGITLAALLLGDTKLLLGDVGLWVQGHAGRGVTFVLDTRAPRVVAALCAGAALALAGTLVQAVTRNPLAEPGLLGVTGGAGLGAVFLVTTVPAAGSWGIAGAALVGATVTTVIVFGLALRGGLQQNRLVLIGVGVATGTTALISLLIVLTDPFNATKALIWLSGSTYGRTFTDVVPVALTLLVVTVVLAVRNRELDLVGLDDHTPRLLGVHLVRSRLLFLTLSVLLTATAIAAIGAVGFVGLVAPHAARGLVGRRHARVVPVALLLGAILVGAADLLGRTVIAPAQLGTGLVTAVIGAPYFVWLLWRGRR